MSRQYRVLSKMAAFVGGALVSRETIASYRDVTLTNEQVLALGKSPHPLVAAPGENRFVEFVSALLLANTSAGAYEPNGNLVIRQTDAEGVQVSYEIDTAEFLDQEDVRSTNALPKPDTIGAKVNEGLVLHNVGEELGGGNEANSLTLRVFYRSHDLTGQPIVQPQKKKAKAKAKAKGTNDSK